MTALEQKILDLRVRYLFAVHRRKRKLANMIYYRLQGLMLQKLREETA